jgi:hypothetical protein
MVPYVLCVDAQEFIGDDILRRLGGAPFLPFLARRLADGGVEEFELGDVSVSNPHFSTIVEEWRITLR